MVKSWHYIIQKIIEGSIGASHAQCLHQKRQFVGLLTVESCCFSVSFVYRHYQEYTNMLYRSMNIPTFRYFRQSITALVCTYSCSVHMDFFDWLSMYSFASFIFAARYGDPPAKKERKKKKI